MKVCGFYGKMDAITARKGAGAMARGKKQIGGQLFFNFSLDSGNYIVQANDLIGGKQSLKLNSAKLIRAAIMQIVPEDEDLKPYIITIKELAKLLKVSESNLYRDIDDITDDIIKNPVFIKETNRQQIKWVKIPWVTRCEYNSDVGVALKLNDDLKPFLVKLKEHYTQYSLDNILTMKSTYSIRIFELLQEKIKTKLIGRAGEYVEISVQELRECCDCEDKYKSFNNFKVRVLDTACKEINALTMFRVKYDYLKHGKNIVAIIFYVNMCYNKARPEDTSRLWR